MLSNDKILPMRKLYRSRYNKKISGICGGLGNYFSVDPNFVRLLVIFICCLTAVLPVLVVYLVASLFIHVEPTNSPAIEYRRLYRSSNDRLIAGICGGLANVFKMDSTVLRLILIVLGLITGVLPMLFTYLICWILIPEKQL